ncbi:MAG TPA: hypothetical protein VJ725_22610 [Thermoanaerobaculia bacterium]|nr:hypothetical protein [Thermoanaerobaculia bacterium]
MSELRGLGGRYRLDGLVVSDGAGSVFRGTDLESREAVAIELVHREIREGDAEARERFLETARALRPLDHPGLPKVLDFGFTGPGNPFLVTDHVHGPSLEDLAGAAPGRLLSLLLVLADSLEALAGRGISVPSLSAGDVLVVPGDSGERIRVRGLGRAVFGEEDGSATLRAFALLAAGVLRISPSEVGIPLELAVELNDPEVLRAFLKAAFEGDPEGRYASFREVRRALTQAFLGTALPQVSTETKPDLRTLIAPEKPEKGLDPTTRVLDLDLNAGEPADWKTQVYVPPPPPPSPPPPVIAAPALPPPPPAKPRSRLILMTGAIAAAVVLAGASYLLGRRSAELPAPTVRSAPAVPVPAASQKPFDPQPLPAEPIEALAPLPSGEQLAIERERARKAAEARAQQKEKAAAALESEAEEAIAAGQFDLALSRLQTLRQSWPERAGLDERIERVRAERQADLEQEAVLAAALRAERADDPAEGLETLARARPNRRLAPRFEQVRERLEAQLAQLDRRPPDIALRGGPEIVYEKGKPARIPLRITDDYGVQGIEGWARAEGGRFEKVTVRQVSGSDYEVEVSPELHGNKTVEVYIVASDRSGHAGQLGSADRPLKVKRKRWIDRVLGGNQAAPGR